MCDGAHFPFSWRVQRARSTRVLTDFSPKLPVLFGDSEFWLDIDSPVFLGKTYINRTQPVICSPIPYASLLSLSRSLSLCSRPLFRWRESTPSSCFVFDTNGSSWRCCWFRRPEGSTWRISSLLRWHLCRSTLLLRNSVTCSSCSSSGRTRYVVLVSTSFCFRFACVSVNLATLDAYLQTLMKLNEFSRLLRCVPKQITMGLQFVITNWQKFSFDGFRRFQSRFDFCFGGFLLRIHHIHRARSVLRSLASSLIEFEIVWAMRFAAGQFISNELT